MNKTGHALKIISSVIDMVYIQICHDVKDPITHLRFFLLNL